MRADASQPVSDGVNANQDARTPPYGGGADDDLRAATTMTVTPATQLIRLRWWPAGLAWALWALAILGLPVVAWLDQLSRQAGRPDLVQLNLAQLSGGSVVAPVLALVSAATVGAVLASRRPRHPVGWLLLVLGLALTASGVAAAYTAYGLVARPGALPAAGGVARYYLALILAALLVLSFILLLTPTGSLPSPRWRWWARATVAAPVALLVALAVARGSLDPRVEAENPSDFRGVGGALLVVNQLALGVTLLALMVAAGSLVARFRRARGVERQQLRWVAWAAMLVALAAVAALASAALGLPDLLGWATGTGVALLPLAAGAAILRYRLYDLDRIISRTVAYGLLTVLLGGSYAAVVLGLGQLLGRDSSLVVAAATLAVAAVVRPARRRVQVAVDRRFNRRHYDAARTIEAFSARLRQQVDLDTLSAELLAVVDQTMQPTMASLWLRSPTRATQDHSDAATHRPT
jgi:hypothetical protein